MARQDDHVRHTIRVPRAVYDRIAGLPGEGSINTKIVNALDAAGSGMSLRDWFAGQALAVLANPRHVILSTREETVEIAEALYVLADAMLAEREKGGAPELLDRHETDLADLELLLLAVKAGDPYDELRVRIEDMLRRKGFDIAEATGAEGK